jgi:hypothetical protein
MSNDSSGSDYYDEMATDAYKYAKDDKTFTRLERATLDLSDSLKSEFEESQPEVTGMWADMINAAMSEVNWYEIAEHLLSEVKEETEAE